MAARDPFKAVMKWLGLIIAVGTVAGGGVTILGTYVFANKSDVTALKEANLKAEGATKLRDYRLNKVEVQVQNVESIARRTDVNVEKLLAQKRIEPAPAATIQPLPSPPPSESLGVAADDPGE